MSNVRSARVIPKIKVSKPKVIIQTNQVGRPTRNNTFLKKTPKTIYESIPIKKVIPKKVFKKKSKQEKKVVIKVKSKPKVSKPVIHYDKVKPKFNKVKTSPKDPIVSRPNIRIYTEPLVIRREGINGLMKIYRWNGWKLPAKHYDVRYSNDYLRDQQVLDIQTYIENYYNAYMNFLKLRLNQLRGGMLWYLGLKLKIFKPNQHTIDIGEFYLKSNPQAVLIANLQSNNYSRYTGNIFRSQIEYILSTFKEKVSSGIDSKLGSNFLILEIEHSEITTIIYRPNPGGAHIALNYLSGKCISNIKNKDNKCLRWSIANYLYHKENNKYETRPERLYKYLKRINFDGIEEPVYAMKDIFKKIEDNNQDLDISLNLYALRVSDRSVDHTEASEEYDENYKQIQMVHNDLDVTRDIINKLNNEIEEKVIALNVMLKSKIKDIKDLSYDKEKIYVNDEIIKRESVPEMKELIDDNIKDNFINDELKQYNHKQTQIKRIKECLLKKEKDISYEVQPEIITDKIKSNHINILIVEENINESTFNSHYILITNLEALMKVEKNHICRLHCAMKFKIKDERNAHEEEGRCRLFPPRKISMPKEGSQKAFRSYNKMLPVPYIIFADTEAILKKVEINAGDNTVITQEHHMCSYCIYVICTYDDKQTYDINGKPNYFILKKATTEEELKELPSNFIFDLDKLTTNLTKKFTKLLKDNLKLPKLEPKDKSNPCYARCYVCKDNLDKKSVPYHDLITNEFKGYVHQKCSKKLKYPKNLTIPIIMHNSKGYDLHFAMKGLYPILTILNYHRKKDIDNYNDFIRANQTKKIYKPLSISCIGDNSEKFKSLTVNHMRFLDSYTHISGSLDECAKELNKDTDFHNLDNLFKLKYSKEQIAILKEKQIFPYEYLDSVAKLKANIPNINTQEGIEAFSSNLNLYNPNSEDIKKVNKLTKEFNLKTMEDLHDLYLTIDVLILADIWVNHRNICIKDSELDPTNYLSGPAYFNDKLYKMTKAKVDLLSDYDMYCEFENAKRGGLAVIRKKLSISNNKYMGSLYDKSKEDSFFWYIDANSLYATAMAMYMPIGDFKWVNEVNYTKEDILDLDDTGDCGYAFLIDLEYPKELHISHNDYPMAFYKRTVNRSEYSKTQLDQIQSMKLKPVETEKLIADFRTRERYLVHYRNLKFYLKHGLRIKKIHKVISFKQSEWMKPYIDDAVEKRKQSSSKLLKNYYKLAGNAVFGKQLENKRKFKSYKHLYADENSYEFKRKFIKETSSRLFEKVHIIEANKFVCLESLKSRLTLDNPIFVGWAILELSKLVMQEFYYDVLKVKYREAIVMCGTDTDSLFLEIKTEDLFKDIADDPKLLDYLDISDYPDDHPLFKYIPNADINYLKSRNMKVLGKFKDEKNGDIITRFCGLRAKMYSIESISVGRLDIKSDKLKINRIKNEDKKAKGTKKVVLKKTINHYDYENTLKNNEILQADNLNFRSKEHVITTRKMTKVALSSFDDKAYTLPDGINTLAYGSCLINKPKIQINRINID